jgi:hypothetical protein
MQEALDFFKNQEVGWPMAIFLMIFSCGIALFHTLIFSGLYNVKLRPKWLFFILNPAIIAVSHYVREGYAMLALVALVASVFLLGVIGMVYSAIKGNKEDKAFNKAHPATKKPLWKKIVGALLLLLLLFSGPYMFVLIFALVVLMAIMPNSKNRFIKYQAILPTSRIRSMAMGLVEVHGKVALSGLPLAAPIENTHCIGYKYTVEEVSRDKDGHDSYSNLLTEVKCNPFIIIDDTGSVDVDPKKLDLIWFDLDNRYTTGSKRYSQYLLKENDEVLIIGQASSKNSKPIIEYENIKDVFAVAPINKVDNYNKYKPLLNSFTVFTCVLAFFTAIVLISPVTVQDGKVTVQLNSSMFNWNVFFSNF